MPIRLAEGGHRFRHTDREVGGGGGGREAGREKQRQRDRDRENSTSNSNSKTLILKDSSVRSIWIYLTASPCVATNTNKHDYRLTTNRHDKYG